MNCIVKHGEEILFTSPGKWLHPLFELEDFLRDQSRDPAALTLEDKIIGRGAAVLIVRMGFKQCHGRLVSRKALPLLKEHGVECTWDTLVEKLECRTETVLTEDMSLDEAYRELCRRAGRKVL